MLFIVLFWIYRWWLHSNSFFSGGARRFPRDDASWNQSMAGTNRVFPCLHSIAISLEHKLQTTLNSLWDPQALLGLLFLVAISTLALILQFLAIHTMGTQSYFLQLFARMHQIAKLATYTTFEPFKHNPLFVSFLVRYKYFQSLYAYFYPACMRATFYT